MQRQLEDTTEVTQCVYPALRSFCQCLAIAVWFKILRVLRRPDQFLLAVPEMGLLPQVVFLLDVIRALACLLPDVAGALGNSGTLNDGGKLLLRLTVDSRVKANLSGRLRGALLGERHRGAGEMGEWRMS
jgi:hypothetical protein